MQNLYSALRLQIHFYESDESIQRLRDRPETAQTMTRENDGLVRDQTGLLN